MSLELDTDKNQNKSLIRAFFSDTKTYIIYQNYTFKYDQKKCFKQSLFLKVGSL